MEQLEAREVLSGTPPVAGDISGLAVLHGRTLAGIDLLGSCSDAENEPLSTSIVQNPSHGSVFYNEYTGLYDYFSDEGYTGPDSFAYQANDGDLGSNTATVSIGVTNIAPVANDISGVSVLHGQITTIDLAANTSDADGDSLAIAIVQQAAHGAVVYNEYFGLYEYYADIGYIGADSFAYQANDKALDSNVASVQMTIQQAYVGILQDDQDNVAGETVSVGLYSWFAPNHTLVYSATGLPAGLSIDSSTGVISGIIAYGTSSPYSVAITATDSAAGLSDDATFDWYIAAPEVMLSGLDDQESIIGAQVELPLEALSTDGHTLTFTAAGLPDGLSLDPETGLISGIIASGADAFSPYSVTVTATNADAGINSSDSFSWSVASLVLENPGNRSNYVGDTVSFQLVTAYAGTGTLTFNAANLPSGLSIDTDTGEIAGTIASNATTASPYSVVVTVTDGISSVSRTFDWSIALAEVSLNYIGDQFNVVGDVVSLPLFASSPAFHAFTFSAANLPDGLSIDSETGTISGTIASGAEGDTPYSVTVTATDASTGESDSRTFTWTVSQAAVSDPGALQNLVGETVNVSFSASGVFTGSITFSATNLPDGLAIDSASGAISGTISFAADANSPYSATITATDGIISASRTIAWVVVQLDLPSPVDQANTEGDLIELLIPVQSAYAKGLSFTATGLPPGLSIDANTGTISGTLAGNTSSSSPYQVTVTATNVNSVSVSRTFAWTVVAATNFGAGQMPAQPQPVRPFGGALTLRRGQLVVPEQYEIEREILPNRPFQQFVWMVRNRLSNLRDRLQRLGLNATGVLTGDIFDPNVFENFNNLRPNENTVLITINGINTGREDALALLNSIRMFDVGNRRVAVWNGTHGLGDFFQIVVNTLGRETIADLRAAVQIELAAQALRSNGGQGAKKIYVVAHSQGTEVFFRALNFLRPETRAMIVFHGVGGQRFVPNDIGLGAAYNYYFSDDAVPRISNQNLTRWPYARNHRYTVYRLRAALGGSGHSWANNYETLFSEAGRITWPPNGVRELDYGNSTFPALHLRLNRD